MSETQPENIKYLISSVLTARSVKYEEVTE